MYLFIYFCISVLLTDSTQVHNLGIILDPTLLFIPHINQVTKTAFFHLKNMARLRPALPTRLLQQHPLRFTNKNPQQTIIRPELCSLHVLATENTSPLSFTTSTGYRIHFKYYPPPKAMNNLATPYLSDLLLNPSSPPSLRSTNTTTLETPRTKLQTWGDRAFGCSTLSLEHSPQPHPTGEHPAIIQTGPQNPLLQAGVQQLTSFPPLPSLPPFSCLLHSSLIFFMYLTFALCLSVKRL
ncbi:hypothetical protein N1851_006605 [Merluccius polli]|uniref:Uncharacterized protein n=1 Tax=Merluccius polli TaxID=89951 RepID=A0AA47N5E7_MERPO|nr:hypothetical protein N1851_006605 [Merluccius polli]